MHNWVVMFTGQGSQQIGMGREWDTAPESRVVWDCASDIAGYDLRRLCWKGPMNTLAQTRCQQIAVTAVNLAGWYALKTANALPEHPVLIGHSVGEYSALHAAGALNLESTFRAVQARAHLMQAQAELSDGAMYAIKGGAYAAVQQVIGQMGLAGQVVIANDNSPRQVVIAGASEQVKAVGATLAESGLPALKLPVNGAWHSPLMAGMQVEFGALLAMWSQSRSSASLEELRDNLNAHVVGTVRWRETITSLLQRGHTQFLEVGPRKVLCGLLADYAGPPAHAIHCQQRLKARSARPEASAC